jgi:hypothetical protein
MDLIIARLNEYGFNGEEFCRQLQRTKTVMAGSFPLQCILGERYEGSDIDLYCHRPPNVEYSRFGQWLYLQYYPSFTAGTIILELVSTDCHTYTIKWGYNIDVKTYRLKIPTKEHLNIQIVILADERPIEEFITKCFDLSFCQTRCDGTQLIIPDGALYKTGTVNMEYRSPAELYNSNHVIQRIQKYKNRGFTIINSVPSWHLSTQSERDEHARELMKLTSYEEERKKVRDKLQHQEIQKFNIVMKELVSLPSSSFYVGGIEYHTSKLHFTNCQQPLIYH